MPADKAYRLPNPADQPSAAAMGGKAAELGDPADSPATFAAALTANGRGAIAVVEVRGPDAHRCVSKCFRGATRLRQGRFRVDEIRYGHWLGPEAAEGSRSGESVVVVATAAEAIEVHCHGGRAAVAQVLQDLAAVGAATLDADAFLERTSASPIRAEFIRVVARSTTERTAAVALDQYRGAMRRLAEQLREQLSTGDLDGARRRIAEALGHAPLGTHLSEPWRVVLAGPPNVGKSSLLNALLGYRRAITFAEPGTTRDVVTADTAIDGWPVRLSDTAGQRATRDPLESEGVRRAETALDAAELVLLVVDVQEGFTETHRSIAARTSAPRLLVWNKSDLAEPMTHAAGIGTGAAKTEFAVSATCGIGLAALEEGISRALVPRPPHAGAAVPVTADQLAALERAHAATTIEDCLAALTPLRD